MGKTDCKNSEGTFQRKVLKYFHGTILMIYLKVTVFICKLQTATGGKVERNHFNPLNLCPQGGQGDKK